MGLEKSRLKFIKSKQTGELIAFVNRQPKSKELKGVGEDFPRGKQICVLSQYFKDLDIVREKTLYCVEMKPMHGGKKGFVVVSVTPILWPAKIETIIVPKSIYQVNITFGYKTIYFDPKDGKFPASRTLNGVLAVLEGRGDIMDKAQIIDEFKAQAAVLLDRMAADGYILPSRH